MTAWVAPAAVECRPWCEDGDGHPNSVARSDQACYSPSEYLNLTLEEKLDDSGGAEHSQALGVMTRQRPDEVAHVLVHLYGIGIRGPVPSPYNVLDHEIKLTPDEALRLAGMLVSAAKLSRVDPTEVKM